MQTTNQNTYEPSSTLYITNLHLRTNEMTIRRHFETYGTIRSIHFIPVSEGRKTQSCFVNYRTVAEATKAMTEMNYEIIDMHMIDIHYGKPRRTQRETQRQRERETPSRQQQVNVIKVPIPLRQYYMNDTISMEVNGEEYQITLTPENREGKQFRVVSHGEEIIIELAVAEDERYERRGDDMIHHVYFDRQYIGMTSEIQLTKINGQSNTFVASLYEGHLLQLPFQGFVRTDGGRGNCCFIIHFSQ